MIFPDVEFDPFFSWVNRPKIMYSPGLRSEVGYELSELGGKKVVVFTDKGIVDAGVAQMVIDEIEKSDLELVGVFDGIVQDARIETINEGAKYYKKVGADSMVVVGGGSVMDTSKAINIMIGEGHDDFKPLADQAALYDTAKRLPPHIAFPTTAGTGSEVTSAMVVLDVEEHLKIGVAHPYCNCDIAMLDPELMVKLPPKITAFTGMDALTHAIEGMTATSQEPIADALCIHAIRLIVKYLPIAVNEPEDVEARGYMLIASTLAGMGFGNSMTGGVHATAHALGGLYGVPHGMANGIMLPLLMDFNTEEAPEKFMLIADAMNIDCNKIDPKEAGTLAAGVVRKLKKECGLTETLKDFDVPDDAEKLQQLVEIASGDSQVGYNPRYLEEEDILKLYLEAM